MELVEHLRTAKIAAGVCSLLAERRQTIALGRLGLRRTRRERRPGAGVGFRRFPGAVERARLGRDSRNVGCGGWHVWAISPDFHATSDWIRLLKSVAGLIGASITAGVCEIFPPDIAARSFRQRGCALRVAGIPAPILALKSFGKTRTVPLKQSYRGSQKSPVEFQALQDAVPRYKERNFFLLLSLPGKGVPSRVRNHRPPDPQRKAAGYWLAKCFTKSVRDSAVIGGSAVSEQECCDQSERGGTHGEL